MKINLKNFQIDKKLMEAKLELEKLNIKTKCDFVGCKNLATIAFFEILDKRKKMSFCDECIKNIYNTYAKTIIPKSIEAPFKRKGRKI